jgi:predicted enzyme related to lactoylglutathione lyase
MIGAQLEDAPGAPCWYELLTHDLERATRFYSELFGWTVTEKDLPTVGPYSVARLADTSVAGLMTIRKEWGEVAPVWNVYFGVRSCDEAAKATRELGGCVIVEPRTVPGSGRFALFADPADAGFDVFELP